MPAKRNSENEQNKNLEVFIIELYGQSNQSQCTAKRGKMFKSTIKNDDSQWVRFSYMVSKIKVKKRQIKQFFLIYFEIRSNKQLWTETSNSIEFTSWENN